VVGERGIANAFRDGMNRYRRHACGSVYATCLLSFALSVGACSSSSQPQSAAEVEKKQSETEGRLDQATQLVGQFRSQIPDEVARRAQCVLIIPGMKKGGLIVGGQGGSGFASCASAGGWSNPAPITMGGGTLGAQAGYESADVLALVVSDAATKALEAGNFKIGVNASATAGPVGAGTSATGDVGVKSDIVSYSRSSGLFAGATVNGMTVSSDDATIRALYGTQVDLGSILEGRATLPQNTDAVRRFLGAVSTAFGPSAVSLGALP
jgi:SH3 domain-containing YSC84-like protein 1